MRIQPLAIVAFALLAAAVAYLGFWTLSRTGSAPPPVASRSPATAPEPLPKTRDASVPDSSKSSPPPAEIPIPAFPWPPPAASAEYQIRNAWVSKGEKTRLADVAEKLEAALQDADYETWRYSAVPHGFALVTQLEQIAPDGSPRSDKERFRTDLPSLADMSFVEFLKALAKAPAGYYRTIVFIVTDTPFSRADRKPTADEAQRWLEGLNRLPKAIGGLSYGEDYRTTALIYEFRKPSRDDAATLVPRSSASGRAHLEKARIWDALTR